MRGSIMSKICLMAAADRLMCRPAPLMPYHRFARFPAMSFVQRNLSVTQRQLLKSCGLICLASAPGSNLTSIDCAIMLRLDTSKSPSRKPSWRSMNSSTMAINEGPPNKPSGGMTFRYSRLEAKRAWGAI
jgi:hypothetical protein